MRDIELKQIITRNRNLQDAENYFNFTLEEPSAMCETAQEIMRMVPPTFGACAMLSATWAAMLNDHHSIPAIVVAGDLKINGTRVFKCKRNIPDGKNTGKLISKKWDGHCWIEIDGYIGDLSIFRTAYSISTPSILKEFVLSEFRRGKGAMLSPVEDLPKGMKYIPKFVLKESQITGLIKGMAYQLENGI